LRFTAEKIVSLSLVVHIFEWGKHAIGTIKVVGGVDVKHRCCLASSGQGPWVDTRALPGLVDAAARCAPLRLVLADAEFDSEANHSTFGTANFRESRCSPRRTWLRETRPCVLGPRGQTAEVRFRPSSSGFLRKHLYPHVENANFTLREHVNRAVKVLCFDTLLQVFILRVLSCLE